MVKGWLVVVFTATQELGTMCHNSRTVLVNKERGPVFVTHFRQASHHEPILSKQEIKQLHPLHLKCIQSQFKILATFDHSSVFKKNSSHSLIMT
ncbi:hypothetical protein BCR33DRAFT_64421 [Rhizoclosmatium globosum]|uniref:Uncharacterized protein n=1 Tax=Rhizoclosmatium globosum TaxID=329046 RepID=A0A1Y2CMR1_9FUNG|nr:hypothetical protein BCR33DRAFT_64421 [Rhizoclosmatium globosum]|eukprot:ORY48328.1 hypothetical protein BCR33DRAFT_64421 [Rhizoclosmatium globosum]